MSEDEAKPTPSGTVHVMCGLVAAGKSTIARSVAAEVGAVRLSRDEWMLRLHGGRFDDPSAVEFLERVDPLMWDVALDIATAGMPVLLDWNFWSRKRRAEARRRTGERALGLVVHWVDVSVDVAVRRAGQRQAKGPRDAYAISEAEVRHFATIFEPPTDDERLDVRHHVDMR